VRSLGTVALRVEFPCPRCLNLPLLSFFFFIVEINARTFFFPSRLLFIRSFLDVWSESSFQFPPNVYLPPLDEFCAPRRESLGSSLQVSLVFLIFFISLVHMIFSSHRTGSVGRIVSFCPSFGRALPVHHSFPRHPLWIVNRMSRASSPYKVIHPARGRNHDFCHDCLNYASLFPTVPLSTHISLSLSGLLPHTRPERSPFPP